MSSIDVFNIDSNKKFYEYLKQKILTVEEIQLFYKYAISQYYERDNISLANQLLQRTSYLEPNLKRGLLNSISIFIPHHFNEKKYLFAKRNREQEKLSFDECKGLLNVNWYELEYHKTNFPIRDRRDRVNKSRRLLVVSRIIENNKLSTFCIQDYIDRKITKIDGRSCVRWNNKYYPVHTKEKFNKYRDQGLQRQLTFFSNLHTSITHEDIKNIDSLEFIFDDQTKEKNFSSKDI